jgi:hypothetical protein
MAAMRPIAWVGLTCLGIVGWGRSGQADPTKAATFTFEGPAPIQPGINNPVAAGAIQAIAIDPKDKNTVWIGSVNGGVWKTTDFHPGEATHAPTWKPLTDDAPSLSVAALSLDPTDASSRTVVAALGRASSANSYHGPLVGVLRTTDGGKGWTVLGEHDLAGQNLSGVAARGATLVVTSKTTETGGIWRSTDTGLSWTRLSGSKRDDTIIPLPDGPATALAGDPARPSRLWVGVVGLLGGIYRSDDTGKTWSLVSPVSLGVMAQGAEKLALDAQTYAGDKAVLYVAVINPKPASGSTVADIPAIFRLTQSVGSQVTADEMDAKDLPAFETLDQGKVAIAADATDIETFFVGGDEGLLFRCTRPVGGSHKPKCTPISDKGSSTGHTGHGTAPHADARALVFDGNFDLLTSDDGGIYMRNFPREDKGDWSPKIGNLGVTETYWCAYDDHGNVTLCGTQDNGVVQQPSSGTTVWPQIATTDGGAVAVSDDLFPCPFDKQRNCSARYFSRHRLADFAHVDCDKGNHCKPAANSTAKMLKLDGKPIACSNPSNLATCGDPNVAGVTPLAADRFDAHRITLATTVLYESSDGGATVKKVKGFSGTATRALTFGGQRDGKKNADLLYAGSSDGLFARTSAGDVAKTKWKVKANGAPLAIALDREDWSSVWIATDAHTVWHGTDVTTSHEDWTEVTGDLTPGGRSARDVRAIVHVGGGASYVAVGADDGVYVMRVADPGHWLKLTGALPNAVVAHLLYSHLDDKLVIATMGRSVWSMSSASKLFETH